MTTRWEPGPVAGPLAEGHVMVLTSLTGQTLTPGSEARSMGCLACGLAIGGAPIRLVTVMTGRPCPDCHGHLLACGFYQHVACGPVDEGNAARQAVAFLTGQPT